MPAESSLAPRARDVFIGAMEKSDPHERAAFIERESGGDGGLRQSVQELLREQETVGSFLETPAVSAASVPTSDGPGGTTLVEALTEKPGSRIGRYKLLQKIGEGGCGVVFMAEQEAPVRRRVALKVIKLGMDTKSVIARFEAERQALAMMDHPNIAKVLDAGATETGRPYFVMELVRGVKITEYSDQNNLSTVERLGLFIQVCQAIQHAHQKGIIHRDIKPSNILVTLQDSEKLGVPKVIDFGIAKATEQRLTDKTLFTEFQTFIGTPAYTSPEQAEMSSLDIDTRSDLYSLGVLLYELLTGRTPFDAEQLLKSGLDEMRRIIREDEPVRPSTRLSTLGMAEAIALTKARQARISALVEAVRGDLDWIVMKCIEKDRSRRYATAHDLAMDIRRHLDSEPILARPPSTAYRIQKFVHRNRVTVAAGATLAVGLVFAVIVTSWMAIRATHAEHEQSFLHKAAEAARQNENRQRLRAEAEQIDALRRAYNSDMNLVQQALAANNLGRVVDLLNRQRPAAKSAIRNPQSAIVQDFRQWEWRYFWNQSRSAAAFALPQQSNGMTAVAFSPSGRLLASSDRTGQLKLWDLATRTEVAVLREQAFGRSASLFAFSRDGSRIASVVSDGRRRTRVKVWSVASRLVTSEFPHEGAIDALAFTLDDTRLLLLGEDVTIRVWDFEQQKITEQRPGPRIESWRKVAAFSADGKSLAIAESGRIHLVDAETGIEKSNIEALEGDIAALAFSPKGDLLAVSPFLTGTSTAIRLFSTETGKQMGQLDGHVSWVPGLAFTRDGERIVSAGADQTVRIWDAKSGRELAAMRGHLSEVGCAAVSPDGKTIVSGCKDGTLYGWDAERDERQKRFETLPISVYDIEFFPDSKRMLAVSEGRAGLWDAETLREVEPLAMLGDDLTRVLVSPDGSRVYAGTARGEVRVLDWATRLIITNLSGGSVRGFPFGPGGRMGPGGPRGQGGPVGVIEQGRTLVAFTGGSTFRLWDTTSWELKAEWRIGGGQPSPSSSPVLSLDARFVVAAGGFGGPINFLNLQTGQVEAIESGQNGGVSGLAYSPDGALLAASSRDGTVNLWDAAHRQVLDVLRGHLLGVEAVTFSPDGQRLATVSHSNEAVKLWDVTTRHEVATLAGEGSIFQLVKFSPDGQWLVAVSRQGKAHFWRAPSLALIANEETRQAQAGSGRLIE